MVRALGIVLILAFVLVAVWLCGGFPSLRGFLRMVGTVLVVALAGLVVALVLVSGIVMAVTGLPPWDPGFWF